MEAAASFFTSTKITLSARRSFSPRTVSPLLHHERRRRSSRHHFGSANKCIAAAGPAPPPPPPPPAAGRPSIFDNFLASAYDASTTLALARSGESLARQSYSTACEAAVNDQIGLQYTASYTYLVLFAYFDRDNVALPGFAKFFEECSTKERTWVKKLMKYQTMRGGKVKLSQVQPPPMTEFNDTSRGDALHAMEYTLALTRIINRHLLDLQKVASDEGDPQLQDFIEEDFLQQQVEDIKMISEYVSQLRRIGEGHGVYHLDRVLGGNIIGEA